jgi:hypothetical protein
MAFATVFMNRLPSELSVTTLFGSSSFLGFSLNLVAPSFVSRHLQRCDKNWRKNLDLIDFEIHTFVRRDKFATEVRENPKNEEEPFNVAFDNSGMLRPKSR